MSDKVVNVLWTTLLFLLLYVLSQYFKVKQSWISCLRTRTPWTAHYYCCFSDQVMACSDSCPSQSLWLIRPQDQYVQQQLLLLNCRKPYCEHQSTHLSSSLWLKMHTSCWSFAFVCLHFRAPQSWSVTTACSSCQVDASYVHEGQADLSCSSFLASQWPEYCCCKRLEKT